MTDLISQVENKEEFLPLPTLSEIPMCPSILINWLNSTFQDGICSSLPFLHQNAEALLISLLNIEVITPASLLSALTPSKTFGQEEDRVAGLIPDTPIGVITDFHNSIPVFSFFMILVKPCNH